MFDVTADCEFWLFRELYQALLALADEPQNTLAIRGEERIEIAEELGTHLQDIRQNILDRYPDSAETLLMQCAEEISEILSSKSLGGDAFDLDFWTNDSFETDHDWHVIREKARSFLLRQMNASGCF